MRYKKYRDKTKIVSHGNHLILLFSPNHLINNPDIALDDFDDFGGDVFIDIIRNRDAVVAVFTKFDCSVDRLKQGLGIYACDDKVRLINRLRSFGAGTDADCREWMTDTCEER